MRAVRVGPKGCPVCHEAHASCGPPSGSVPVDVPEEAAVTSGPLKRYTVTFNGTVTTMKLSQADAERLGGIPADAPTAGPVTTDDGPADTQPPPVPNKARKTATTKGGPGGPSA